MSNRLTREQVERNIQRLKDFLYAPDFPMLDELLNTDANHRNDYKEVYDQYSNAEHDNAALRSRVEELTVQLSTLTADLQRMTQERDAAKDAARIIVESGGPQPGFIRLWTSYCGKKMECEDLQDQLLTAQERERTLREAYVKRDMIGFVEKDEVGPKAIIRFKFDGDAVKFVEALQAHAALQATNKPPTSTASPC